MSKRSSTSIFLIGFVLTLLAGMLTVWVLQPAPPQTKTHDQLDSLAAISVQASLEAASTLSMQADSVWFREKKYITLSLDPGQFDVRIFNPHPDGGVHTFASIEQVAKSEQRSLVFLSNGGMFTRERGPLGLLVIQGETLKELDRKQTGYGNFYLQPNGVFATDRAGNAFVVRTQAYDSLAALVPIAFATQSGPMMVIDSCINPLFTDGSSNLHIRNAVGTTASGRLVFAISSSPISFFDLSSVMLAAGCQQALYLDGYVSQAFVPALEVGSLADGQALGPIIAVFQ